MIDDDATLLRLCISISNTERIYISSIRQRLQKNKAYSVSETVSGVSTKLCSFMVEHFFNFIVLVVKLVEKEGTSTEQGCHAKHIT